MEKMKKSNSGYTLVEFIIVLAIIAVLSGMATVTIASISSARATAAKESFNQALSTLQTVTKAQQSGQAIELSQSTDGTFTITFGTYDGSEFEPGDGSKDVNLGKCEIYYTAAGSSASTQITGTMIIQFNKQDGSVASGAGTYVFCKSKSEKSVGRVTLNASSGSHYTGSVKGN